MSEREEKKITVETLLKEAELRAVAFEDAVQTGEADATPQERAQFARERARAKKLLKYRGDVQQTLSRAEGRRVLWRVLEILGPNRISHTPGDPYSTAFNEGKRSAANEVLLMMFDADPNVYAQMQHEYLSDLKAEHERQAQEQRRFKDDHES